MTQEEKKIIEYCDARFREVEKQEKELTKEELMNEIMPKPKVTDPELIKRIDELEKKCDEMLSFCEETRMAYQINKVFEIAGKTIGIDMATVKAMSAEEYAEWAKEHVRENEDGTLTIF